MHQHHQHAPEAAEDVQRCAALCCQGNGGGWGEGCTPRPGCRAPRECTMHTLSPTSAPNNTHTCGVTKLLLIEQPGRRSNVPLRKPENIWHCLNAWLPTALMTSLHPLPAPCIASYICTQHTLCGMTKLLLIEQPGRRSNVPLRKTENIWHCLNAWLPTAAFPLSSLSCTLTPQSTSTFLSCHSLTAAAAPCLAALAPLQATTTHTCARGPTTRRTR